MSNETCVVTIADIYGAEWWERNKAELDREWEWGFGVAAGREERVLIGNEGIEVSRVLGYNAPRIILHRRKPKPPALREVYGTDEVKIPVGWEWTGEWRVPTDQESGAKAFAHVERHRFNSGNTVPYPRLILRERPKKVWFKAEGKKRVGKKGDWIFIDDGWTELGADLIIAKHLCATRHEEVDQTVQVVTQQDIDKCVR